MPRYQLTLLRLSNWFPLLRTMAEVTVFDLSDRSTFTRRIPAVYLFHLHWLMQEAIPTIQQPTKERGRSFWLQAVLDSFAVEIKAEEDMSNWRSQVLNPVLVRAFYGADDFDKKHIEEQMKNNTQLSGKFSLEHWEGFYLNQDVVAPVYRMRWLKAKTMDSMGSPAKGNLLLCGPTNFPHVRAEITVREASIPPVSLQFEQAASVDHIQTSQKDAEAPGAPAEEVPEPDLERLSDQSAKSIVEVERELISG